MRPDPRWSSDRRGAFRIAAVRALHHGKVSFDPELEDPVEALCAAVRRNEPGIAHAALAALTATQNWTPRAARR